MTTPNKTRFKIFNSKTLADVREVVIPFLIPSYRAVSVLDDILIAVHINSYNHKIKVHKYNINTNTHTPDFTDGLTYSMEPDAHVPDGSWFENLGIHNGKMYFYYEEVYSDTNIYYAFIFEVDPTSASVTKIHQISFSYTDTQVYTWGLVDSTRNKVWLIKHLTAYDFTANYVDIVGYDMTTGSAVNEIHVDLTLIDGPNGFFDLKPVLLKDGEIAMKYNNGDLLWLIVNPDTNDGTFIEGAQDYVRVDTFTFYDEPRNVAFKVKVNNASGGIVADVVAIFKDRTAATMLDIQPEQAGAFFIGVVPYLYGPDPVLCFVFYDGSTLEIVRRRISIFEGSIA